MVSTDLFVYFEPFERLDYGGQLYWWALLSWDVGWYDHRMTCWDPNIVSGNNSEDLISLYGINFVVQWDKSVIVHSQFLLRKKWITLVIFQKIKAYQAVGFRFSQSMKIMFEISSAQTYGEAYDAARVNGQLICSFQLSQGRFHFQRMFIFEGIIDFTTKAWHTCSTVAYRFDYAFKNFYLNEHTSVINNRIQCLNLWAWESVSVCALTLWRRRSQFKMLGVLLRHSLRKCPIFPHLKHALDSFQAWFLRLQCLQGPLELSWVLLGEGSSSGRCVLADCCLDRCYFFSHSSYFENGPFGFLVNRCCLIEKAGCDLAYYFAVGKLLGSA